MNFKTQDLARVFCGQKEKKIKQQHRRARSAQRYCCAITQVYMTGTVQLHCYNHIQNRSQYSVRTQIGINSVCNHRIDQRRLFLGVPFVGENNYIYIRKKGKLNSSTSCFADVNECATGKHKFNGSSICNNTKGYFLCICLPKYLGVNCTGKYIVH